MDEVKKILKEVDNILNNKNGVPFECKKLLPLLRELWSICKQLEKQATVDFLTGLYNRRFFKHQLELAIERAKRYKIPFSLIILDIDHFKRINDQFGHLVGDQVLKEVAKLIKQNIRKVDIPARYGGEEFVVIIPGTGIEGAISAAKRLRKSIESHRFGTSEQPIRITVSMGVSTYSPFSPLSAEEFLAKVDQLLYAAKEKGRNCIVHELVSIRHLPEGLSSEEKEALIRGVKNHDD